MSNFPANRSAEPEDREKISHQVCLPRPRNRFFRFLASLRLALLLLAVIIVADAAGTIYESEFSAEVARAYIYEAWWFNLWLLILCVNLAAVAFSRRPWKRHHTGFLLTHFGIITLLVGAVIGRLAGIEGTTTLFKGHPPATSLVTDQRELRITPKDQSPTVFRVRILPRSPSAGRPAHLGRLQDGTDVWATDYARKLDAVFSPVAAPGGAPAVKLRLTNGLMNQNIEQWVMLNSEDHQTLDLGLIKIAFKSTAAGTPLPGPAAGPGAPQALEETIFAFANNPEQQVDKVIQGGSTGTRIALKLDRQKPMVTVRRGGREWTFAAQPGHTEKLGDFSARVENYWPDFRITDNGPASVSDQPNNPAVLVTIRGRGVVIKANASAQDDPHAETDPMNATHLGEIDISNQQQLSYRLAPDPGKRAVTGPVKLNQPIATNWGAWTLTVIDFMPSAQENTVFHPAAKNSPPPANADPEEGLKVRLVHGQEVDEEWVAMGWSVDYPVSGNPNVIFSYRTIPLPFGIQLTHFQVDRQEGSDSPAAFKSTLLITDTEGNTFTGSCSMNEPMNYPDSFWRSLTGFTYKISQASWNPDNLDQSSVQILFDPGWSLKWLGSLIICLGIFCLFYLQPPRRGRPRPSAPAPAQPQSPPLTTTHV